MAGSVLSGFVSLLEHQQSGRLGPEQLAGLLSLYALVAIVDYLQQVSGGVRASRSETVVDSTLRKALSAVLGNSQGEGASGLADIARSVGKNPAALMGLVNLLTSDQPEDRKTIDRKGKA
ncbi:MAG: hypothetical protein ACPLPT_08610 [Moorellales bacterium]